MNTNEIFDKMLADARAMADNPSIERERLAALVLLLCNGLEKLDSIHREAQDVNKYRAVLP